MFSVIDLYPLALLEGEGMGTAYEYSVKLTTLRRMVDATQVPQSIFVGGLPEAYGVDLDLALFAGQYGSSVIVADDRQDILQAFSGLLALPELAARVRSSHFEVRLLDGLTCPTKSADVAFDLWVSTSAIQRLDGGELASYLSQIRERARYAALFAPNKANKEHLTLSGLDGFLLPDLVEACTRAGLRVRDSGYLDMPPFPPGLKRSAEAKERAAQSWVERTAMRFLEHWGRGERLVPLSVRRRFSHLVYVFLEPQ